MRSILSKALLAFFLCTISVAAFGQINPSAPAQFSWPKITGNGTPTATGAVCNSAHYGQPYQNTAVSPNTQYHCGTTGWVQDSTGGGSGIQYPTGNVYVYGDSRTMVSSSCYLGGPDSASITSGSISGGVLTAVTTTNYYGIPDTVTLSGFTGGAAGLNGQTVVLTSATSSTFVAPVSGITTLGSTGTGVSLGCTYNLSGYLRAEPFINGHGTVINGSIPALDSGAAITDYSTTAHLYSPAVTGNPGTLVLQVGGQDWLNSSWSLSTTEANIQTLLVNARADNWTAIVLTTVIPHVPSLYNNPPSDIIALNAFIRALTKTQANLSTGYADWIEDAAQILPDPTNNTYVQQTGTEAGHLTDVGSKKWADDLNSQFASQGNALLATPYCGTWADLPCLQEGNTWGGVQTMTSPVFLGTPDASGASQFKLPVAPGGASAAQGEVIYDSTDNNWHWWVNGADNIMLPLGSGFTSGHCGQPTKTGNSWYIADAGASCTSSSGAPAPIFGTGNPFGVGTPTIVNHVAGSNTFSATSGNRIFVFWKNWNANDNTQPTAGDTLGTVYTLTTSYAAAGSYGYTYVFSGVLTGSGSNSITMTGAPTHSAYTVFETTQTSTTVDGSWVATTSLTPSITTTVANDLVVATWLGGGGACPSVPSGGWVGDCYRDNGWVTLEPVALAATTAGAYTLTWGSNDVGQLMVALKADSTPVAGTEGQIYYDTTTTPYTAYVYHTGAWVLVQNTPPLINAISSATGGSGTGTVTCLSNTCTNVSGSYSVVGGTFATGTVLTLVWPTTGTAYNCWTSQNGGVATYGVGHGAATATGLAITTGVSVAGVTLSVDYGCSR